MGPADAIGPDARLAHANGDGRLFLGISGGSWATMCWLSTRIEDRLQTLAVLNVDIKQTRRTLAQLGETT